MNLRTEIEDILKSLYGGYGESFNVRTSEQVTDQILSLVSQHYVSRERVKEEIEKMDFEITPIQESIDAGMDKETAHTVYDHATGYKNAIKDISRALLSEDRAEGDK